MKVFDNEPFEGFVDTSFDENEEDEKKTSGILENFMKLWVLKNRELRYIQEK